MVLRCTARLLKLVGSAKALVDTPAADGDWYANVFWIERRKCLQLMHAATLFPVVLTDVRVGELRPIGRFVTTAIHQALADEDVPLDALGTLDAHDVCLARTASRQLLGFMNDDARTCQHAALLDGGIDRVDVDALNWQLRRTLHNLNGAYVTPIDRVHRHLSARP